MHLRSVFFVTAILALAVAAPAPAAIMIDVSPGQPLNGGLSQFVVSAQGTAGELIAGFDGINLTGAHQVFRLDPSATPGIDNTGGFGWGADWTGYDSHVLVPNANKLGSVGAALAETNDMTTTGTLDLSMQFGSEAPSGFGTLASSDGTDGFRLLPAVQSSNVPFLQVVTDAGTAFLNLAVAFSIDGVPSTFRPDMEIVIGGGGPENMAPTVASADLGMIMLSTANPPVATNIMHPFVAMDDQPLDQLSWMVTGTDYVGTGTGLLNAPTIDANGKVSWLADGSTAGKYTINVKATDAGDLMGTASVMVDLKVPEPTTFVLCGLALVGLVGFTRRQG
jgi:hypothetical protein